MDHQVVLRCRGALCAKKKNSEKNKYPNLWLSQWIATLVPLNVGQRFITLAPGKAKSMGGMRAKHVRVTRHKETPSPCLLKFLKMTDILFYFHYSMTHKTTGHITITCLHLAVFASLFFFVDGLINRSHDHTHVTHHDKESQDAPQIL